MSMSNYANFAYTIPNKEVEKLAPKSYTNVFNHIAESLSTFEVIDIIEYNELNSKETEILAEYLDTLYTDIRNQTGMDISLHYHESEERGDDISGYYFTVDNAVIPNPDISTYDLIKPAYWVTYG